MALQSPVRVSLTALAVLLSAPALGASASSPARRPSTVKAVTSTHSVLQSTQLWATIDECNYAYSPNWIGIRGSMPGDGHSAEIMYMRFRLQSLDRAIKHWVDREVYGPVAVGRAKGTFQAGRSFLVGPPGPGNQFVFRGVVDFQWRRGTKVVNSASRPTTAHRQSLASHPAGFSAATCSIS